ncbi:peroxide stress protein YaaA [Paenalcaligenes niemegkensis]|uniref:peroxide stress protein YaaA n=1 Tax=Paenalcaligenes niemegkensis TaxID=2895469 RepID=UPI001EE86571|nr:peroxide stress protein YaaA [Paenalcaligenes niemegkensis]MCQ9616956.1 peroxide stress protein YaaA [Paenalcaligenes niemegkensis]
MLFLLSPAKKLDYDSPVRTTKSSQPLFVDEAQTLNAIMREKSAEDLTALMRISDDLARLNVERFAQWKPTFTLDNSRQAILAFNGDVYEGLKADELSDEQLQWTQDHLIILSGLYGALRPLDLMRPYRLEMGTRLANPAGKNLYEYWGSKIGSYLAEREAQQKGDAVLVNLASDEYFKAVDLKAAGLPVVQCVFQDEKNGVWKIISFYAKKARGLMMRYAIDNRITTVKELTKFDVAGYAFQPDLSTDTKLVFQRPESVLKK